MIMLNIKFMSDNQWWCDNNRPAWKEMGLDCSAAAREVGFLRLFAEVDADIIGLQECSALMADLHMQGFSEMKMGYALLWGRDTPILYKTEKFELIDSSYLVYPVSVPGFEGEFNNQNTKSYCIAVLRSKETGDTVIFGTTHLWYMSSNPNSSMYREGSDEARTYQLGLFMDKAEEFIKKYDCPAVIVGDMNSRVTSVAIKSAFARGWVNARDVATDFADKGHGYHKCDASGYGPYIPQPAENAIDQVLVKNAKVGFVRSYKYFDEEYYMTLSDHLPILIDVKFD